MNRVPLRKRNRDFYVAGKAKEGDGVQDCYGRVYIVAAGGNLRKIKDIETGPNDPRRGRK